MAEIQKKNGAIHKGHRQRVKGKVKDSSLKVLSAHEILELMLMYPIPYKDTNELAHRLISSYGNIKNVFYVPREELQSFNGVGEETAFYLNLIGQLHDYLNENKQEISHTRLASVTECMKYFRNNFDVGRREEVFMVFTDDKGYFLRLEKFSQGGAFDIELDRDRIYKLFAVTGAKHLILFHTHPYGSIVPSSEDLATTQEIVQMCQLHHVKLFDHIIVNKTEFYSFHSHNLIQEMTKTAEKAIKKMFEIN